jgi:hypothetical protein
MFELILTAFTATFLHTTNSDPDAALTLLRTVRHSPDTYNEIHYLYALNHFALNDHSQTAKYLRACTDSFHPLSRRQASLVQLMSLELEHWTEGDLCDSERDMRRSVDRLRNSQTGTRTQEVQKQIVEKLDRLIREQEGGGKGSGAAGEGQASNGKAPGQQTSPAPAPDSSLMGGQGKGAVDEKKLRWARDNWGQLTPEKRAAVVQEITNDLPPKYREHISAYFKSLNRVKP